MNANEHYAAAEALIEEGEEIVERIGNSVEATEEETRARRDDLGKKAMGIWAQAQAHATLALAARPIVVVAADITSEQLDLLTAALNPDITKPQEDSL